MALIKCPECQTEISKKAKVCPKCGHPIKKKGIGCGSVILIIFLMIIIAGVIGNMSKKSPSPEKSANTRPSDGFKLEDDIKVCIETGLLVKINPQLNEAYVNPVIWHRLDYGLKEKTARSMAFYCGLKKGTNLNWVEIKDSYSGKKLAKYSQSWGFKVY